MPLQKISREEIVRKSIEVFRQRGFHRTSMNELAAECGLQKGSFYHHFSSKEEILKEGLEQTRAYFEEHIFVLAQDTGITPKKRMKTMLTKHIQTMMQNNGGCLVANMVIETANTTPELQPLLQSFFSLWHDVLAQLLKSKYSSTIASRLAWHIVQDVEGSVLLARTFQSDKFTRSALQRAVQLFEE